MADYALVPVDYQPEFEDYSLVPVDYDPFGDAPAQSQPAQAQPGQQAQTTQAQAQPTLQAQQAQGQQAQTQQLTANGSDLPETNVPANASTPASREPYNPNSGGVGVPVQAATQKPTASPISSSIPSSVSRAWGNVGAAMPEAYGASAPITDPIARALISAATLPQRAIDAARVSFEHNYGPGPVTMSDSDVWVDPLPAVSLETALTMMGGSAPVPRPTGMILGANKVGRGGAAAAFNDHHSLPMYLGGAVKQELVRLPTSLHKEFHRRLDRVVPKQLGKAYYDNLGPAEKQRALDQLGEVTQQFDADYGTKIYDALLKNGFPAP